MRKYKIFCLVMLLIAPLCACATGNNTSLTVGTVQQSAPAETQARQYRIAFVMKTLTNPFFVDMENGARRAEKDCDVKVIVKTGAQETSIEQQIQIVEEIYRRKLTPSSLRREAPWIW